MDNDHFRTAMLMRLGALECTRGAVCQVPKQSHGEKCLQALDDKLVHPLVCKCGPARQRPHRSVCHTLARLLKQTGAHTDMERAVPQLYMVERDGTHTTEAILDV
eukprot:10175793-Karenia_brevis.AAC.1